MFKTPEDRLSEIELYELVAEEIENNQQSKGLWVKALSDSEGDLDKGQALYVKLRVQMIKDEWAHLDKVRTEKAEARAEAWAEAKLVQQQRSEAEKRIAAEKSREAKRPNHEKKAKFALVAMLFFVVLVVVSATTFSEESGARVIFVISIIGAPLMLLKSIFHAILGAPRVKSERAKTMAIRFGSAQLCNVCNSRVHYFSNDGSGRCWNCVHPSQPILDQR